MDNVRRLAVAVLALGCDAGRQPDPGDSVRAIGTAQSPPSAAPARWRTAEWHGRGDAIAEDLGRGVVFLAVSEDKGVRGVEDTLLLRGAPDPGAAPVGAMIFSVATDGATTYRVAAPDSIRPNLVEHGYEESGVPFDSTDDSGRWVRAILGFRADGSPLAGWVDSEVPGTGTTQWAAALANRPIFFPRPEVAEFYSAPDSNRGVPAPQPGTEYAIYPEAARGPWLRVRVVQPSDLCMPPDSLRRETRILWIRYLDARGRPTVWYYTRGC